MLHREVVYTVVFSGTGFASNTVGIALESGGYSCRTPRAQDGQVQAVFTHKTAIETLKFFRRAALNFQRKDIRT
jgi:hypothetical protein